MLARLDQQLASIERLVAALALLALLLLSVAQILTRNLFDTGFVELDLLSRHLLIIAGLMGASVAITERRHIRIDALAALMSEKTKRRFHVPLMLFACATTAALAWYAGIFCLDEWQYAPVNERWALPLLLAYPASFSLMSLHFLLACFRHEAR